MKKSTKLYHWFFTQEEREPIGFIPVFFMTIAISAVMCWFITKMVGLH